MAADAEVQSPAADINIRIAPPVRKPDISTILGLSIAIGLIIAAIAMGNADANF